MNPASAIHQPAADWAASLRAAARREPPAFDHAQLLAAFRQHSGFYSKRIGTAPWQDVPPLEKTEVAQVPLPAGTELGEARTSGTTGYQVSIRNSATEREFRRALLYRPQLFSDLPAEVTQVVFVDGDWCASPTDPPKWFDYGGSVYRTWFCGVGADTAAVASLLTKLRPQLVRGIASGIVRFIENHGASLRQLGVQIIGPGGEFLLPAWRALMTEAFGARVLDRYGSTETGAIAWQCPLCDAYHANADELLLEPEAGGLLATPLFIGSQPLLRYRLGDVITMGSAGTCEIRLPTVEIRQARRDDWLIDGAGQRVSPLVFQFEQVPGLRAWRLHQAADGSLCLYYEGEAALLEPLRAAVTDLVPGRPLTLVPGVWQESRTGKFKRVSSEMPAATNSSV